VDKLLKFNTWPEQPFFNCDSLNIESLSDLTISIERSLHKILAMKIDAIVGIPRSGLLAANILALRLNIPVLTLDEFEKMGRDLALFDQRVSRGAKKNSIHKILVMDDSINSGEKMRQVMKSLAHHMDRFDIKFSAIYSTAEMAQKLDLVFKIVPQPRVFEWNFFHHMFASDFLYDLDGVLCVDGAGEDDEDLAPYINHIANVRPKYIPTQTLGAIVTSRLEKHRAVTEEWLFKNNIKYKILIMCNLDSASERRRLALHGKFKAYAYLKYGGRLFIESELWQAKEIAKISSKPVFCTENMSFIK